VVSINCLNTFLFSQPNGSGLQPNQKKGIEMILRDENKAMECLELYNSFSEFVDKYQNHVDNYIGLILDYDEMLNI